MSTEFAYDDDFDVRDFPLRTLRDDVLYRPGDPRSQLYLMESGTVAQFRHTTGRPEVVEFSFAGDVVGFGSFEKHVLGAQAVGEVRVRCLPPAALKRLLHEDQRAFDRYTAALEREFQCRRDELTSTAREPLQRVAALLVALSSQNGQEGRDPSIVGDALDCRAVAEWIGMDVAVLGQALIRLQKLGLIEARHPHGLRLLDIAALTALRDGSLQ